MQSRLLARAWPTPVPRPGSKGDEPDPDFRSGGPSRVVELHDDWARWTDPSTPAEELVDALALTPLPSPAELAAVEALDGIVEFAPECR